MRKFIFGLICGPILALLMFGCAHNRDRDYPPPNYYQQQPNNYCVPPQHQPCAPVQGASYSPNTQGNWAQPKVNCACP